MRYLDFFFLSFLVFGHSQNYKCQKHHKKAFSLQIANSVEDSIFFSFPESLDLLTFHYSSLELPEQCKTLLGRLEASP